MNGGKADRRFSIVGMMQDFGWTYQEYLERPAWIDTIYKIKLKSEAKAREIKAEENRKKQSNG